MKPLKPGDRIAAYGFHVLHVPIRNITIIISVSGEQIVTEGGWRYHRKQCRLLTKRKAREWWLGLDRSGTAVEAVLCSQPLNAAGRWVHVREVMAKRDKN